jgi:hypothetical protein
MKNIIKSFMLLSIILALCSCSKGSEEACKKCVPLPPDKQLSITLGTIEKTFDLWKNDGRKNHNDYYVVDARTTTSSSTLAAILRNFNLTEVADVAQEKLVAVVFFINRNISSTSSYTVSVDDIEGMFLYFESGNKLAVKVFDKKDGKIRPINELTCEAGGVYYNDMQTFANTFFDSGVETISSILISDDSKTGDRPGSNNYLPGNLKKYYLKDAVASKPAGEIYIKDHGAGPCDFPCPNGPMACRDRLGVKTCNDLATDYAKKKLNTFGGYPLTKIPETLSCINSEITLCCNLKLGNILFRIFITSAVSLKMKLTPILRLKASLLLIIVSYP